MFVYEYGLFLGPKLVNLSLLIVVVELGALKVGDRQNENDMFSRMNESFFQRSVSAISS